MKSKENPKRPIRLHSLATPWLAEKGIGGERLYRTVQDDGNGRRTNSTSFNGMTIDMIALSFHAKGRQGCAIRAHNALCRSNAFNATISEPVPSIALKAAG